MLNKFMIIFLVFLALFGFFVFSPLAENSRKLNANASGIALAAVLEAVLQVAIYAVIIVVCLWMLDITIKNADNDKTNNVYLADKYAALLKDIDKYLNTASASWQSYKTEFELNNGGKTISQVFFDLFAASQLSGSGNDVQTVIPVDIVQGVSDYFSDSGVDLSSTDSQPMVNADGYSITGAIEDYGIVPYHEDISPMSSTMFKPANKFGSGHFINAVLSDTYVSQFVDFNYTVPTNIPVGYSEVIYKDDFFQVQVDYVNSTSVKIHYYYFDNDLENPLMGIVNFYDNANIYLTSAGKIKILYANIDGDICMFLYCFYYASSHYYHLSTSKLKTTSYFDSEEITSSEIFSGIDLDVVSNQSTVGYDSSTGDWITIDDLNGLMDGVYDNTGALTGVALNLANLSAQIEALSQVLADTATPPNPMPVEVSKWRIPKLLKTKFPFCIPFDLIALFRRIALPPKVPDFEYSVDYIVTDDITVNIPFMDASLIDFEPIAKVSRLITKLFFVGGLMMITRKVLII